MSGFGKVVKNIFAGGLKCVGKTASNVADATRYKLGVMDNKGRMREAITELGEKVYSLYQAGVEMPEEALPLLNEMRALDEGLETMETEHAAKKEAAAKEREEERAARKEERAVAKAARKEERAAAKAARKEAREAEKAAKAAAAAQMEAEADEVDEALEDAEEAIEEDADDTEDAVPVMEVVDEEAEEPAYDGEAPVLEFTVEENAEEDETK